MRRLRGCFRRAAAMHRRRADEPAEQEGAKPPAAPFVVHAASLAPRAPRSARPPGPARRRRRGTAPRSAGRGTAGRRERRSRRPHSARTAPGSRGRRRGRGSTSRPARSRNAAAYRRAASSRHSPPGNGSLRPSSRLTLAVARDRLALEVADLDVVEARVDLDRDVAAGERELCRLPRPPEARVHAQVEPDVRDLRAEPPGLLAPLLGQRHRDGRIPVDALLEVQRRLRVAGEEEEQATRRGGRAGRRSRSARRSGASRSRARRARPRPSRSVAASGASTMFRKSYGPTIAHWWSTFAPSSSTSRLTSRMRSGFA